MQTSARAMGTALLSIMPLCELRVRHKSSDNDPAQRCSFCVMRWYRLRAEQIAYLVSASPIHGRMTFTGFVAPLVCQSWRSHNVLSLQRVLITADISLWASLGQDTVFPLCSTMFVAQQQIHKSEEAQYGLWRIKTAPPSPKHATRQCAVCHQREQ